MKRLLAALALSVAVFAAGCNNTPTGGTNVPGSPAGGSTAGPSSSPAMSPEMSPEMSPAPSPS
ncbi:MAG: hypothetical protein H0V74_02320 [Chloroflexi bacterium]|nr:hypothetical protein [Chloroflexota bacterium]